MDAYELIAIILALIIVCPRIMKELYPNSVKKKDTKKFSIKSLMPKFALPGSREAENKEKEEGSDNDVTESE